MSLSPSHTRTSPRTAPNVFPASQYLQERLEERRSRVQRPRRSRQSDIGPQLARNDDLFVREGDSTSSRHGSTSTHRPDLIKPVDPAPARTRSTGGGMRHLNEQIDRLTKLNFDLKLEIDHRRAHQVKLTSDIERMRVVADRAEQLAAEHAELLKINGQLVEELEKRDKAMQEAVEIICDLEERAVELEDDRQSVTRASTVHADSGYAGTETLDASSSPEKQRLQKPSKITIPSAASHKLNTAINSTTAKPRREPSFMAQKDAGSQHLRSVYQESTTQLRPVKSFHSILSKHTSTIDDDDAADMLNSPRFSNLSESSFPSIYSPKKHMPDRNAWEPADTPPPALMGGTSGLHSRQDSISRVSQWIEGYDVALSQNGSSVRTLSPPAAVMKSGYFQSLDNTLVTEIPAGEQPFRPHTAHDISRRSSRTPTSFGGPIFGEPLLAQPSDTASSKLLRASRSTIIDEKSLSDAPNARFYALQAQDVQSRTTPRQMRSSLELQNAFASNLEYRKTNLSLMQQSADCASSVADDDGLDARDMHPGWLGYPDGGSILLGTPSRFFKQDTTGKTARHERARSVSRRKSSSAAAGDSRRPDLIRAGTSPRNLPSLTTFSNNGRPRTPMCGDARSPNSFHSNTSSNRTAFATDHRSNAYQEPRSPPTRSTDRIPPSPARTLSQRTQSLLRRLSGSHGSDRDPSRQISPSPSRPVLPSLTSTPSSAYVNVIPKDQRRANADASLRTPQTASTPTPIRTRAGSEVRSPPGSEVTEKRGLFGRRGSFKQVAGIDRSKTATPSGRGRRRSSVREVITQGKRW